MSRPGSAGPVGTCAKGLDADSWPVPVTIHGWHAAFWALLGLGGLSLVTNSQLALDQRVRGGGALTVLGVAYAGLVHRRARQAGWRAHLYLVLAVVVTSVAAGIDRELGLLLCIVYPQVWMFTQNLPLGAGYTVALTAGTMLGYLFSSGFTWQTVRDSGPQMAVVALFSLLLGVWISRIVSQSVVRAELIQQLESARSELNEAEHARGVMAERERMAREIHDTLAQGFTSIVMLSQAAAAGITRNPRRAVEQMGQIEEVARENLAEARALVAAFSPVGLENSTLPDAVRRLTERFVAQTGIAVDLEIAQTATTLLRDQEVVLLRAVQEAMTNVRRHADARHVAVRLLVDDTGARVEIGDDGVGFSPDNAGAGYGLAGMRGRVADVGGEMEVASIPGAGTRVTVQVRADAPATAAAVTGAGAGPLGRTEVQG